jgi:hypothetical protein
MAADCTDARQPTYLSRTCLLPNGQDVDDLHMYGALVANGVAQRIIVLVHHEW